VKLDVLCGGMPDSHVPGTVSFDPKSRTCGKRVVVVHVGEPFRVFSFTLQGYKPIDCRPLTVI
jgi:hypothetical protein